MKKWTGRILLGLAACLLFVVVLLFLFRAAILTNAGKFMAPQIDSVADVAILEGTEFISRGVVMNGVKLLSSGKVKKLILVLNRISAWGRPFGLNDDYPDLVRKQLEALGVEKRDFQVIVVRVHEPVTLTAAKGAMEIVAKEGAKSAVLLSPGFHARRSYLVYQHVGGPFHIRIMPSACFDAYELERWWSQDGGMRDFGQEFLKLIYYMAKGYIPLKLSY
jgi:hypothetical protein